MTHSSLALQAKAASCKDRDATLKHPSSTLVAASFKFRREDDDETSIEIVISISFGHIMCWIFHCAGVDKAHALNEHSGREDSIGYVENFV